MPTYDYICKNCDNTFEFFQTMSADPITICPACKGDLRRIVSGGTGLIFKGSGFYLTDYKKNKQSESGETKQKEKSTVKEQKENY